MTEAQRRHLELLAQRRAILAPSGRYAVDVPGGGGTLVWLDHGVLKALRARGWAKPISYGFYITTEGRFALTER